MIAQESEEQTSIYQFAHVLTHITMVELMIASPAKFLALLVRMQQLALLIH